MSIHRKELGRILQEAYLRAGSIAGTESVFRSDLMDKNRCESGTKFRVMLRLAVKKAREGRVPLPRLRRSTLAEVQEYALSLYAAVGLRALSIRIDPKTGTCFEHQTGSFPLSAVSDRAKWLASKCHVTSLVAIERNCENVLLMDLPFTSQLDIEAVQKVIQKQLKKIANRATKLLRMEEDRK